MLARPPTEQHTYAQSLFVSVHVDYFSRKTGSSEGQT
jgi:hypothetical protein